MIEEDLAFIPGEIYERGRWHHDGEYPMREAEFLLSLLFANLTRYRGIKFGDITFEDMPAEHQRAPGPPPESGMRFLAAWAEVKAVWPVLANDNASIIHDLTDEDLQRLRAATRRGAGASLSDEACDACIDRLGPEIIERMIMAGDTLH